MEYKLATSTWDQLEIKAIQDVIKTDKFYSKSKNSPFDNYKVKGRAIKTIINGIEVYSI